MDREERYRKQLGELTKAYERLRLKKDTEIYYLEEIIADFKALCNQHNIQYDIVLSRDNQRRAL